ncbi:hypothetical protein NA57DRAFT_78597 [Rhizodiscina lignyota]|uniref:Uncharacterized protein n=1 Tax=Rhizodiscina lignyota TaxID=1504668 RepID=A0A9P4I898_9PEZI|nr:hypothetical protein NA57DRAFT_78597 [Rhizodiscina lignyota]
MSLSRPSSPAVAVSSPRSPSPTLPQPPNDAQPTPHKHHGGPAESLRRSTSIAQSLKSDVEASDTGARPRRTAVSEDEHAKTSNRRRVKSSTGYKLPRLLPYDKSFYSEESLPTAALTTSSTTLAELAHLIRLQGYQERKRSHARVRLHRWLVSNALSSRLVHCGELSKHPLMDAYRADDKRAFATLYNAIHDVRNSCDATRRFSLLEPDLEFSKSPTTQGSEKPYSDKTFLHEIPSKTREELLAFLSALRTDPEFLVQRLISLTGPEIETLASFRPVVDTFAVMARPAARGKVLGAGVTQKPLSGPSSVERLLSFQRHDPLSALFYTIFATSSGPDSTEDLRRTEVWSTVCAKLVADPKPGSERLMHCVLDAFAEMREWPGKQSLELYLMQVLQDGQFILERRQELMLRSRLEPDPQDAKFVIRQDDFFEAVVHRLFEIIDDEPSAGGIPEGVLEIGTAINRKITEKKHRAVLHRFIVHRWFFAKHLTNAIVYPEHYGIMIGYYISESARKAILEPIAIKAQKHVLDMTYNWQQNVPVPQEIRTHIDSVLARFKQSRSLAKPVLLPAKAITSPRETVDVQPFIVLCPSDIVTLVNGLFPERRPPSGQFEKGFPFIRGGLASAGSSISGLSAPFPPASTPGDGSSVLSMSVSSVTSDTTSRAPLLDESDKGASQTSLELVRGSDRANRPSPTDEYGQRLRIACSEMTRVLGSEAMAGNCHPCAERWAVLYVSRDGKQLHLRARKDYEEDDDPEDDTTSSDSEEEGVGERIDLANDYHQLKQAIAKLVEEYEIPKELAPESESKEFSNRTSIHRSEKLSPRKRARAQEIPARAPSPPPSAPPAESQTVSQSKNPYLNGTQSVITKLLAQANQQPPSRPEEPTRPPHARTNSDPEQPSQAPAPAQKSRLSPLVTMLEAAVHQCQSRSDYVSAQLYHRTLQQLRNISAPSLTRNGYAPLLNYFSRGPRDSLAKCASAIEEFEAWFVWLKQAQERSDTVVESLMGGLKSFRDKMWYTTDVCHSAAYEEAKNVAMALRTMGLPPKSQDSKQQQAKSKINKTTSSTFLLKQEGQVLELMAASNDTAGPNKLTDEQSERTAKWLLQYGIENFCKGEERIHRFCLEVDQCVNKLVGDGILDGPVLWSSELYRRDKDILDSGREKGDLLLTGIGSLSIAGEDDVKPQSRALDFAARPSMTNLRSVAARNPSQQSFESGKWSSGKPTDLLDSQDYFGTLSPVLAIDSSVTFWSPYQGQTPTQSLSAVTSPTMRPRTSSSARSSVIIPPANKNSDDKKRFLLDLKQTLTGLLLSDLGNVVFNNGCETDAWFSGELGQECMSRKEADDRRRKRIARKKSMKGLKSAKAAAERDHGESAGSGVEPSTAELSASTSSDATARKSGLTGAKKPVLEFPYSSAFQRLLHKFTTNPNPFSKLHALYELELLIVASLSTKSNNRNYSSGLSRLPPVPQSPTLGAVPELSNRERQTSVPVQQAQNLEDVIANVAERRSASMGGHQANQARQSSNPTSPRARPADSGTMSLKPGSTSAAPSTDMIVEVLQGLFRDAEIRPKTLFRDLQYIASFVPGQMLDRTPRGKAFWDAGLAALGLKQDVCRVMIEIADDIVALNTESRTGHASTSPPKAVEDSVAAPSGTESTAVVEAVKPKKESSYEARLAQYSMADAAKMLIITAKEGDAVAERELAIFYLTHPDLLPRTLLPLTKPKDVFKAELIAQRERDRKKGEQVLDRADPMTMCVAHHWMECSKKGGDQLATKYLRARDEIEKIP